jgi:uncharacterized protein YfiM (DUF2279 family)
MIKTVLRNLSKTIIMIIFFSSSLFADEPFFQQKDKQKHIAATAAISGTATALARYYGANKFEAFAIGVASGLLVGIAKEKWDAAGHGTEDIHDVYADTVGSVLGSAITAQFSWKF